MYTLMFMYGVLATVASVIAACMTLAVTRQNGVDVRDENKFIMITSTIMIVVIAIIIAMNE